ncbi:MAG: GIY-YIG nuclease family protein [Deltaproteobacteria bacterium]|nr:GIY-YIG nuclease family protein [Deltaproteobacteria bacterium]
MAGRPYTPASLADEWGCSERTLRKRARELGACCILGKTMLIFDEHVDILRPLMKSHKLARARPRKNVVYFLRCGDFIKIGWSKEFGRRIKALSTSSPYDIELITTIDGSPKLERELHKRFSSHHHRNEWFRLEGELAYYIAGLAK